MTTVALSRLLSALESASLVTEVRGTLPLSVNSIADDSRRVTRGTLFIAVRGSAADGHTYLANAAASGAAAAVVEDPSVTDLPCIVVSDGRKAAPLVAAAFYGDPARALTAIAVTGTNGKTTTVGMLRCLLDESGGRAASIGTLGVLVGRNGVALTNGEGLTTPGPVDLQRVLRELVDSGVKTVALEASSHALDQRRLDGIRFQAAVFTNLTRDHLDYHHMMESYFAAKATLVSLLAPDGVLVLNDDDRAWDALEWSGKRRFYGLTGRRVDVTASDVAYSISGSSWTLHVGEESHHVDLPLIGDFNVTNALGAAAAANTLGLDARRIAGALSELPQVPGRLERLSDAPVVLRDYAHTPDALERALTAVAPFAPHGRVIVVFGCGGDRDPGKRPVMGGIAERLAGHVIITSDNPRTEDPEKILDAIEAGMRRKTHERIEDRRAAIARAIEIADPGRDIVLLAGKGHETYQVRGTERLHFDEAEIVGAIRARGLEGRRAGGE